ncbi:hypothetical protein [Sporomusa acidovorans]|uniref:Uncharacterized protein n=1 Tax=Sporomusa acidovorans (strain ATCC 49682 / DSM 3132 / Mol) TaxID=1123286 RepID=A0ABZ3IYE6_SPOA4|nr:hypothetical protein [Sporomusa acidovorans]OZC22182.1 hypothetical protein SPACI_15330 [Sporomusa acidovorans DSM 3132]SDE82020.1 hypothetical protein SAMN04488499_102260 [Sporomusa acidovorans]
MAEIVSVSGAMAAGAAVGGAGAVAADVALNAHGEVTGHFSMAAAAAGAGVFGAGALAVNGIATGVENVFSGIEGPDSIGVTEMDNVDFVDEGYVAG